jgi:hypothetical protein
MLFPHLLNRKSFVTELGELDKFFLNLLQPFLPVAVSDVGFRSLLTSKSILFVQLLNVSDFRPKTRNPFPKNFKMIHSRQDNASLSWERWRVSLDQPPLPSPPDRSAPFPLLLALQSRVGHDTLIVFGRGF